MHYSPTAKSCQATYGKMLRDWVLVRKLLGFLLEGDLVSDFL